MTQLSPEKSDILGMLDQRRQFLLTTAHGLSDEQANARPTASELCIGGLIKHVTDTQQGWVSFMQEGADSAAQPDWSSVDWDGIRAGTAELPEWLVESNKQWSLQEGESLSDAVAAYEACAARTREVVAEVDLDLRQELPPAPWFEEGQTWSNREVLLHLIGETAQHAGHADIIRESIDGQKTMG